jgi:hypothetical protein
MAKIGIAIGVLGMALILIAARGDATRNHQLLHYCDSRGGLNTTTYDGGLVVGVVCKNGMGDSR